MTGKLWGVFCILSVQQVLHSPPVCDVTMETAATLVGTFIEMFTGYFKTCEGDLQEVPAGLVGDRSACVGTVRIEHIKE